MNGSSQSWSGLRAYSGFACNTIHSCLQMVKEIGKIKIATVIIAEKKVTWSEKKVHWRLKMCGMLAISLSHIVLMSEQIFGPIAKEFGTFIQYRS